MADLTIADLDPEKVLQAEEFLIDVLKAEAPSLDLSEGRVLRNLLIRPAAQFHVLDAEDLDRLRRSMSMKAIEADPTLADDEIVDGVLSNYRIERQQGTKASGLATIVIQNLATTPVDQGTIFEANGLSFETVNAFVGVTTLDAVLSSSQRLISQRNDGLFSFTVPVQAVEAGEAFKIKRNTRFTVTPEPAGFIDSSATEDFVGGTDTQTNAALVELFQQSLSPKVLSGRIHIESLVRETVPSTKALSIIGFGDAEMLRDRHNIFVVSHGGKADLYVRTEQLPESRTVLKTATLIDKINQIWQISLLRDDAPGFYTIDSVLPEDSTPEQGSFEVTDEVRGLDLSPSGGDFVPDVDNLVEGAYSRYQTAVVKFIDTDTDTTDLTENVSTQDYKVNITAMPKIKELQEMASARANHNPNADYLVRAPVPAFVSVSLRILLREGDAEPDVSKIQQSVADRVNALGFSLGTMPVSVVHDACHDILNKIGAMVVSPMDLICRLRKPAGEILDIRSANQINVPDLPAEGVTSRTTVFYLAVNAVDVVIDRVPVLPV